MLKEPYVIGVDEAGLGPVFGPLVIGGVRIRTAHLNALQELGVKDSKLFGSCRPSRLRRKLVWRRAGLFVEDFQLRVVSAKEIDDAYLNGITMYDLEGGAVAQILNSLKWQSVKAIYLHQLGQTSKSRFFQKLQKHDISFSSMSFISRTTYEIEADSKYIPVATASILAKVTRDALVGSLCQEAGEQYISGYPNTNTAIFLLRYLERFHNLPPDTRRTRNWRPLQRLILKEKAFNRVSTKILSPL